MSALTSYTTLDGDTWTGIAYKSYGDVSKMPEILLANFYVPAFPVLPGGIVLNIPILEPEVIDSSLLPPWKR